MAAFVGVGRMLDSVIVGLIKPTLRSNSTVGHSLHQQQTETFNDLVFIADAVCAY